MSQIRNSRLVRVFFMGRDPLRWRAGSLPFFCLSGTGSRDRPQPSEAMNAKRALRPFLVGLAAAVHLSLAARILGDYLVYQTGLAGKLPILAASGRLRSAWGWL